MCVLRRKDIQYGICIVTLFTLPERLGWQLLMSIFMCTFEWNKWKWTICIFEIDTDLWILLKESETILKTTFSYLWKKNSMWISLAAGFLYQTCRPNYMSVHWDDLNKHEYKNLQIFDTLIMQVHMCMYNVLVYTWYFFILHI